MIPPHTNRYPKPPSGAATGWGRFFCVSDQGERAAKQARGAKDTWAVMAKSRAVHARPLQTSVSGQSFHPAERGTINRTQKHPKNRLVRHCGQNAHNSSENMCNFLNKTPLRKGGFFGTIKLCKSVCLELCPEQDWGTCQMTQDLCGPDNRTAL